MRLRLFAKKKKRNFEVDKGFATLLAILFIFAIGMAVAVFSLALGIGSSRFAVDLKYSADARTLADLCAESGTRKIIDSPDFTGSENLSFSQGDCDYTVTSTEDGGEIFWQIDATGTSSGFVRRVRLDLSAAVPVPPTLPFPVLETWREVASFD